MLEHGSAADEVDVLFGQAITPSLTDKLSQPGTIPGG
jgi:hypothetical protein